MISPPLASSLAKSTVSTDETRVRILAAARQVFARKGSRGTTTREIAELAGLNEATLFRHFKTKSQLLEAMREHYLAAVSLRPVFESLNGTLEDELRIVALAMLERMRRNEDLIRVSLAEEHIDPMGCSATWRGPVENFLLLEQFIARKVDLGQLRGDPAHLAATFATLMFGYIIGHRKVWRGGVDASAFVDISIPIFLKGALP